MILMQQSRLRLDPLAQHDLLADNGYLDAGSCIPSSDFDVPLSVHGRASEQLIRFPI